MTVDALAERVFALYRPPFRVGPMGMYAFDAKGNTIADKSGDGRTFRVRGWAWIQYRGRYADLLFDAAADALHLLVANVDPDAGLAAHIDALNAGWSMEAARAGARCQVRA